MQRYKDGIAAAVSAPRAARGRAPRPKCSGSASASCGRASLTANILLQDSDTIIVPPAERFYVTGFVPHARCRSRSAPGLTVRQAIAEAGGITERGSTRGVKIIRKIKHNKEVELDAEMSDLVQAKRHDSHPSTPDLDPAGAFAPSGFHF